MKTVDARGLSCPQPVILLKKAMGSKENAYELIADSQTVVENCTRFAKSQGYNVSVNDNGGEFKLSITK
jgi:TusA-related sulfurtransferase